MSWVGRPVWARQSQIYGMLQDHKMRFSYEKLQKYVNQNYFSHTDIFFTELYYYRFWNTLHRKTDANQYKNQMCKKVKTVYLINYGV